MFEEFFICLKVEQLLALIYLWLEIVGFFYPQCYSGWCHLFSLANNSFIFNFFLLLGIDVKKGRGRYIDTCMVTFAPRYLLDNKSSYKLAFVQREFARGRVRCLLFVTCFYKTSSLSQHLLTVKNTSIILESIVGYLWASFNIILIPKST